MPHTALAAESDPTSRAHLRLIKVDFARTARLSALGAVESEDDQTGFETEPANAPALPTRLRAVRTAAA